MHYLWTGILGAIAILWVLQGLRMVRGMAKLPRLGRAPSLADAACPPVSVLFAARDEGANISQALSTQLAQDYPQYEVIAVDDRSRDATPEILDDLARRHQNLKVIHVAQLPTGWLGKPHALSIAYQHAAGEWLAFTDADVAFAPGLLRRTLALAIERKWDHLTALPLLEAAGFWEKIALSYFTLGFVLAFEPWRVSDPRSSRYLSVGAFQLLRRSTYEAIGAHRRLAMEIADDTKLGKLVKQAGFHSGVALGEEWVRVRGAHAFGPMVASLSKNFFPACRFRLRNVAAKVVRVVAFSLLPILALLLTSGAPRELAAVAVFAAVFSHAWATRQLRVSPLYALTHPLGAVVFCYLFLRSTTLTILRGGVEWRETFYPLDQLRRGMV